jgi:hypothetical protein
MRYIARIGALWLGAVGAYLLFVGGGVIFIGCASQSSASGLDFSGFIPFGLIGLVLGAAHMAAAVGVWRRRTRGRWLSAGLGGVGLVASLVLVVSLAGAEWTGIGYLLLLVPVGYGLALVGSVVWYPTDPSTPT